jgi:recombination protein U
MIKGKELEKRANKVNLQGRQSGIGLILQIPTPLILTNKGVIPKESTVDFAGLISGGRFLAFDAKETHSTTSFPMSNIKQHQFTYLDLVEKLGGIAFFLIQFVTLYPNKAFCTPVSLIRKYQETTSRKSIPISDFDIARLVDIDNYLEQTIKLYELG